MRLGQKVGNLKSTQPNTTDGHATDSEDRSTPGEFDFDEPENLLEQVQASKNTTQIASQATGRPARYIRLTPAAATQKSNDISVARHTEQVCSSF